MGRAAINIIRDRLSTVSARPGAFLCHREGRAWNPLFNVHGPSRQLVISVQTRAHNAVEGCEVCTNKSLAEKKNLVFLVVHLVTESNLTPPPPPRLPAQMCASLKFQAKKSEISFRDGLSLLQTLVPCVKTFQTLKSGFPSTAVGFIIVKPFSKQLTILRLWVWNIQKLGAANCRVDDD